MNIKNVIIIILGIIVTIFIIQNIASVTVTFLFFKATMPRALMLIATLVIGIIIGVLLPYTFKKK